MLAPVRFDLTSDPTRPVDYQHCQTLVPEGRPARPPRVNFAGHCVYCGELDCLRIRCLGHHLRADWQVCRHCDGSGFDTSKERLCTCYGGLEDMANSEPCRYPRPARLTFAGWCIWCLEQWCTSDRCIERHATSTWGTCTDCDGRGVTEFDVCGCAYGLVETAFTGDYQPRCR